MTMTLKNKSTIKVKIQSNIPMPSREAETWGDILKRMKPGQSFLVPDKAQYVAVYNAAKACKVTICSERKRKYIRIWRKS